MGSLRRKGRLMMGKKRVGYHYQLFLNFIKLFFACGGMYLCAYKYGSFFEF